MDFEIIQNAALLVLMFVVFGVPALALAARIALRPVLDVLVRVRDLGAPRATGSDARVAKLEAEVTRLADEVRRLSESEAFSRQLLQATTPTDLKD